MRRRSREITIFNMSTLDLFACATGAFILLTLILLPYYLNIDRSYLDVIKELKGDLQATRAQLADTEEALTESRIAFDSCEADLTESLTELQQAQSQIGTLQSQLRTGREQLREQAQQLDDCSRIAQRNFILVVMSWKTVDDIDLHVVDPQGRRFYYDRRSNNGSDASFEEDNTRGPGNEIWLHPAAQPGEYKVYYNFYRRKQAGAGKPVLVRGTVFHQQGKIPFPETTLTRELAENYSNAPLVATIVIGGNGQISIR